MSSLESIFPALTGWEPTRKTLHLYSRVVGAVPRAYAPFHPKWWHISLKVYPSGLTTDDMPLPDGGSFSLKMDLRRHKMLLLANGNEVGQFTMTEGRPATALAGQVLAAVTGLGLTADYARDKFENDEPREYDPAAAEKYLGVIVNVDRIFKKHRATLSGAAGPAQLWPHGFDLSFEWFGTRMVEYEEHDQVQRAQAQLSLGFSPGEPNHPEPYFYSNPWPFEKELLINKPLPPGARWFTHGWQGTILPYAELVGDPNAEERLLNYARTVYEICAPTLT